MIVQRALASHAIGSHRWLETLAPVAHVLPSLGDLAWMEPARAALDEHGESLDPETKIGATIQLDLISAYFGRFEAIERVERLARESGAAGNRYLEMMALSSLASFYGAMGDTRKGRLLLPWLDRQVPRESRMRVQVDAICALLASYDADLRGAKRLLARHLAGVPAVMAIGVATYLGQWTEDEAFLRSVLACAEALPPTNVPTMHALTLPLVRAHDALVRGEFDAARTQLDAAIELGLEFYSGRGFMLLTRADLRLAQGDHAGAAADVAAAGPSAGRPLMWKDEALIGLLRGLLARHAGDRLAAETCVHESLACSEEHRMSLIATWSLEALALLRGEAGRSDEAGVLLGATLALRERTGFRWRMLHMRDALDALRPNLDPAQIAKGAELSLWDAIAWIRRGRGERGRPDHGWASLTPTEERVVELVTAGLANKEIAARLFVSLATVKTHLVHVFAKLGVRTRAELAAAATRRMPREC